VGWALFTVYQVGICGCATSVIENKINANRGVIALFISLGFVVEKYE
jgi:hypothetical protein